jgi:hypothetical protein
MEKTIIDALDWENIARFANKGKGLRGVCALLDISRCAATDCGIAA